MKNKPINSAAKALSLGIFRHKVVKSAKGKGSYSRKEKHKQVSNC